MTTKTYVNSVGGTYTIKFISCPPKNLVVDLSYVGPYDPFILQNGLLFLLDDPNLNYDNIYFQGECAAMVKGSGAPGWGEGSGDRGVNTYNIIYCDPVPICCEMTRAEASGSFVGGMFPECGIFWSAPGVKEICYKICHPND